MTADSTTVVYVAGAGRSGSTLLDRILGTLGGFSGAELNRVWLHGVLMDHGCACGVRFGECPFWREVVRRAMGENAEAIASRAVALQGSVARSRDFFRLYSGLALARYRSALAEYRELLRRLFSAMAEVSGKKAIIDSSKVPTEALVLSGVAGLDVRVVHLVRDPRACVYSWTRHRIDPGHGGTQGTQSTLRTIRFWNARNFLAERLASRLPYVRVTYEALVADPEATLRAVCDSVGAIRFDEFRIDENHAIDLPPTHAVSGNPSRYRTGPVELRADDAWRREIEPSTARVVTTLTAPLLRRYGYPLDWRGKTTRPLADAATR